MTTLEEAKLAIDLVGLEYPADIEATYNDLPTNYNKLILLREHLYYLYTIGTETNNDELADYALFANLHVRYRILQFQTTLTTPDEYYRRIYEQKLPRMKWHPLKVQNHEIETIEDEIVTEFLAPDVNEVKIEVSIEPEYLESHIERVDSVFEECTTVPVPDVKIVEIQNEIVSPAVQDPLNIRSVTYDNNQVILRSYKNSRLFTVRLSTQDRANCVGLSGYGVWFYDCDEIYSRLFRNLTGRFSYYEDAAVFIRISENKRKCHSLISLALKQLSKSWFTSPPIW